MNLVRWVLLVPYLLVVAGASEILRETIFLHMEADDPTTGFLWAVTRGLWMGVFGWLGLWYVIRANRRARHQRAGWV